MSGAARSTPSSASHARRLSVFGMARKTFTQSLVNQVVDAGLDLLQGELADQSVRIGG